MFRLRKLRVQAKKRPVVDVKTFRWKALYNWVLLFFILLVGMGYLTQQNAVLPVKVIQLSGHFTPVNENELKAVLNPFIGAGLLSLDIYALKARLYTYPWVQSVSVRRIWPDQLRVQIVARKPVARRDDHHLISDQAVVFPADTRHFRQLPLVYAENNNTVQLLSQFHQLNQRFEHLNESITALRQDSRGALDVVLRSGLSIKLGREQIAHKMTRFIAIYKQHIQPRRTHIQQLDLRYSNGLAVVWRKEALQNWDNARIWRDSWSSS